MNRFNISARLFAIALFASGAVAQTPALVIQDAWMRQAPGSDVAAVYLSLHNTSAKPATVIGVQSPAASHAMIHETTLVNGQSQMRMREKIDIAPGQTLRFAPGGLHIMLSGLEQGAVAGKSVPLTLLLADGGQVTVAATVRPFTEH